MNKIRHYSFLIFLVLMPLLSLAEEIRTFNIYFDINKYLLKTVDREYIKSEIDYLSDALIRKIVIVGHTDNSADSLYNINLSNKRAGEVKKELLDLGFNELIIETGFYGENKPVVKNDNEKDRQLNRRTEVIVYYSEREQDCALGDTIIRTRGGKEIVFDGCEFRELEACLEIMEDGSQNDYKKGIIVVGNKNANLQRYGKLQVNLLDGCSKNDCFQHPVRIRMPLYTTPDLKNMPWVLVKGEKVSLKLVTVKERLYYEFELKCPTSWINCNCKKNQKH